VRKVAFPGGTEKKFRGVFGEPAGGGRIPRLNAYHQALRQYAGHIQQIEQYDEHLVSAIGTIGSNQETLLWEDYFLGRHRCRLRRRRIPWNSEFDQLLIEAILANVSATIARYVPDGQRDQEAHGFSEVAWEALNATDDGDLQITWARVLVGLAIVVVAADKEVAAVDAWCPECPEERQTMISLCVSCPFFS